MLYFVHKLLNGYVLPAIECRVGYGHRKANDLKKSR